MSKRSLTWLLAALLAPFAQAAPEDPSVYKIRNRWLGDQFLRLADGQVAYGPGDDASYRWILEDAGGFQRIKSLGGGSVVHCKAGGTRVDAADLPAADATGSWAIDVVVPPWRALKNKANGKYLNCERKLGHAECDGDKAPGKDTLWSAQWEFVHVGGPKPPPPVRRNQVAVSSPAYGADIDGDTTVVLRAPGLSSAVVKCWKQGEGFGADSTVATVALDAEGKGSFVFPAKAYPHGPLTVRITGSNGALTDNCYLQLYNKGGVSWNEGIPAEPPPAAKGMTLVFADDFKGPLSISGKDPKAAYYDHKPPNGTQDFSSLRFTSHDSPKTPFSQVDTYLRIRASEKTQTAGLISSMKNDGSGVKVSLPCYFECRFIGPNGIGTWPGYWLMTDYMTDYKLKGDKTPCDELDIIEAYGGEGPRTPNSFDAYQISPHCWNQGETGKAIEKKAYEGMRNPIRMKKFGIPSTWYEALHVYGCKVTETDTMYYCDNIEVGRHATLPICKEKPLFFMVNLATGGGWPVDLSRTDGIADMYIDYVRVYKQ
ncbi:MAG: family 16 glycosylhydrolase [Planctomycetes bacterium]|nr:family 16 glycosylhydrolase [Planctomycetota bacterium]